MLKGGNQLRSTRLTLHSQLRPTRFLLQPWTSTRIPAFLMLGSHSASVIFFTLADTLLAEVVCTRRTSFSRRARTSAIPNRSFLRRLKGFQYSTISGL